MRAIEATRFGDPEVLVLGRAPDPIAGPGEVVIEIAVTPANAVAMPSGPRYRPTG
ncbi:MAG: hypothetical protein QOE54_687 [Streptosporangiaceae bacterium]|jgi:NADPH:quinone reductase-like Zn-dependent oxidoreductase|nr:hypothetical protein [Streptosporangiaceae bacterium]